MPTVLRNYSLSATSLSSNSAVAKPSKYALILYPLINALFGLMYGTLYAPSQALLFGLDFKGMLLWILQGLPWDVTHAIGNLIAGLLIVPLSKILLKIK